MEIGFRTWQSFSQLFNGHETFRHEATCELVNFCAICFFVVVKPFLLKELERSWNPRLRPFFLKHEALNPTCQAYGTKMGR